MPWCANSITAERLTHGAEALPCAPKLSLDLEYEIRFSLVSLHFGAMCNQTSLILCRVWTAGGSLQSTAGFVFCKKSYFVFKGRQNGEWFSYDKLRVLITNVKSILPPVPFILVHYAINEVGDL